MPTDYKIGFIALPLKRRHWIAVRRIADQYYNLDSKLDRPLCLGNEDNMLAYLRTQLESNDKELFLIVHNEVEKAQSWLKESTN